MTDPPSRRQVVIANERGLHARASAKFVETARRFDADVTVRRDAIRVSADSIMEVLMLAASCGAMIEIEAHGPEAAAAVEALASLVEAGFGEG